MNQPSSTRPAPGLVVIGASAGAIQTLSEFLPALPASFPVPLVAVVHVPPRSPSLLSQVFSQRCALRVLEAEDKESLAPGTLYFAPPDYHVLIESDGRLTLNCDEPVHHSRPSIDVLFDSAADSLGAAVVGVLLTGANDDGARGLANIQRAGGYTVVQDPASASVPAMPRAALSRLTPDALLAPAEIARFLLEICDQRTRA